MYPHGHTVTVIHRNVTRDAVGNEQVTPAGTTVHNNVAIAPRPEEPLGEAGEEVRRYRTIIVVGYTIFFPPGAVVGTDDRISITGFHPQVDGLYFVDGLPAVWANPYTGHKPGVVVAVRRVTG